MEHVKRTPRNPKEYNTELRILMLRRDLTQAALAARLGVQRQYLNAILTGRKEGARIRVRLVREFDFPDWVLDRVPRSQAA